MTFEGKTSKRRPENSKHFRENFDRIFGKKKDVPVKKPIDK